MKLEMTVITSDYIDKLKAQALAGDSDAKDVLRGIDDFNANIDLQVCGLIGFLRRQPRVVLLDGVPWRGPRDLSPMPGEGS